MTTSHVPAPPGYVLVPIEPTSEILFAITAHELFACCWTQDEALKDANLIWIAALAAAVEGRRSRKTKKQRGVAP